jgi:hypothetical protein
MCMYVCACVCVCVCVRVCKYIVCYTPLDSLGHVAHHVGHLPLREVAVVGADEEDTMLLQHTSHEERPHLVAYHPRAAGHKDDNRAPSPGARHGLGGRQVHVELVPN